MKRADVPDDLVIEIARGGGGVIDALIARGVPRKVALAKVERLCERGMLSYGVHPNQAWPTERAIQKYGTD